VIILMRDRLPLPFGSSLLASALHDKGAWKNTCGALRCNSSRQCGAAGSWPELPISGAIEGYGNRLREALSGSTGTAGRPLSLPGAHKLLMASEQAGMPGAISLGMRG